MHHTWRAIEGERKRGKAVGQQVDPEYLRRGKRHHERTSGIAKIERVRDQRAVGDQKHLGEVRREKEAQEL
jgi:hypothetical protein